MSSRSPLPSLASRFLAATALLTGMMLGSVQPASAQTCTGGWLHHAADQVRPGIDLFDNRAPECVAAWDPDGPGPEQEWIVVGGLFERAGNTAVANIAAFDGTTWRAFGAGLDNRVTQLAVLNGQLYAAGHFITSGAASVRNVARWDGSAWQPLGVGPGGGVREMIVWNGQIVVDGPTSFGTTTVRAWNGAAWSTLGSLSGGGSPIIDAFATFNGQLVVGGDFTTPAGRIATWNGSAWVGFPSGLNGRVNALAVRGGDLFVAGSFTSAGGTPATNVARWNGSTWSALGAGIGGQIQSLEVLGDELFACGTLTTISGNVARWNGSAWSGTSSGLVNEGSPVDMAVVRGRIHAVGAFRHAASNIPMPGIAVWNGPENRWQAVSSSFDRYVRGFAEFQGHMYACGWFTRAGGNDTGSVAKWDGLAWEPVGECPLRATEALVAYNGQLIAAGAQLQPDGTSKWRVIRFDGNDWLPLTDEASSDFVGGAVIRLIVYNGDLYAAGYFTHAGGVAASRIARWNGTSWSPLQQGLTGTFGGGSSHTGPFASAMAVYNNELYVGGAFVNAGSVANVNHVARWNGTTWSRAGTLNGWSVWAHVSSLAVFDGQLYATGNALFSSGIDIGRWNGTSWTALSTGLGEGDHVGSVGGRAMCVHNGKLYVGGVFSSAGGVTSYRIARWTGSAWQSVGSQGLGSYASSRNIVGALASYKGEVLLGGLFESVNSGTFSSGIGSGNFARFSETNIPWMARNPQDASVCAGAVATFEGASATGYANVTYRWQIETSVGSGVFVDLAPNIAPGIGAVSGETTPSLSIATTASNSAERVHKLRLIARNACGQAVSSTASLHIHAAPVITQQPDSTLVCAGSLDETQPISLLVGPASVSYDLVWQIEDAGVPGGWRALDDTLEYEALILPGGEACGLYRYAAEGIMFAELCPGVSGTRVRAVVSNGCGTTTSTPASLTICVGDFNCDGGIDGADPITFFEQWEAGGATADVNEDGGIDGSDVVIFFERWEGGC